ncbi:MAG: DegV family protein [Chloroflexi bacterium]|nr:DegV family protein [Chloroflexota bacterium]
MAVKVVTDSTCDLPKDIVRALGITVVPLRVHFGEATYRDGVDITPSVFFSKLASASVLPTTSQPSAGEFTAAYQALARETDEILSIHISAKLSGTCNSALVGRQVVEGSCRIEIIDSLQASMGLGLIVIAAARAAQAGQSLDQMANVVRGLIPRTYLMGSVESLEYLHKGGRIGKASVLLGSLLGIKPIIGCHDGEAQALGRERTRAKAMARLVKLVEEHRPIDELAVLDSNTPSDAEDLADRLSALFPRERMVCSRFGPVLGTYLGPGALGVAFIESER